MTIVLLGPPGAGKGTLAGLLEKSLNIEHISTGDILREEMKNNTSLGQEAKKFIESGDLVPDEVVTQIIENKITQLTDLNKGYMLDGFPRTDKQAKELDRILNQLGQSIDYTLNLDASIETIIARLSGRRVCRDCGSVYHIKNRPSKKEGICDQCDGELYQRSDDNEETIKNRMEVYLQNTEPIIEFYRSKGILKELNANKESDEVQLGLLEFFNENGKIN